MKLEKLLMQTINVTKGRRPLQHIEEFASFLTRELTEKLFGTI
jgi:hypothetical protein